jgi:hypothetical protein
VNAIESELCRSKRDPEVVAAPIAHHALAKRIAVMMDLSAF